MNSKLAEELEQRVRDQVSKRGSGQLLGLTQTPLMDRRWGHQLVAIDNIVWAVHRKLNYGDTELYGTISQRIAQGGERYVTVEELMKGLQQDEA